MHHAVIMGDLQLIDELCTQHNCSIQSLDTCGSNPLHLALLCEDRTNIALWLVDRVASLRVKNALGSPVHLAAFNKNVVVLHRMYEKDHRVINVEVAGYDLPIIAAMSSFECLEFLAKVTELGGKSLCSKAIACNLSQPCAVKSLKVLVECGADPNIFDENLFEDLPIIAAAKRGWRDVVEVLLPETAKIANVEWTIEGIMDYTASESFQKMDHERIEVRVNQLKSRLLSVVRDRNYLAADLLCKLLYADMERETWDRYASVYRIAVKLLIASHHHDLTAKTLHLLAVSFHRTGEVETAISRRD